MGEAAELAGWMRLAAALPILRQLAESGPAVARAQAMIAADDIEPWATEVLALMAKRERTSGLAVLSLLEQRDDRPYDAVFPLLHHADATVRQAAARSLPAPSQHGIQEVLRDEASTEVVAAVLVAAARSGSEDAETLLLAELQFDATKERRRAVLAALAALPRPLARPDGLWSLAADSSAAVDERCLALLALERTKTPPPPDGVGTAREMPPVVGLFACRYLLTAGVRDAYLALCDLLTHAGILVDGEEKDAIVLHAKQLLAVMAGTRLDAGLDAWRAWFEQRIAIDRPSVPEPPAMLLTGR